MLQSINVRTLHLQESRTQIFNPPLIHDVCLMGAEHVLAGTGAGTLVLLSWGRGAPVVKSAHDGIVSVVRSLSTMHALSAGTDGVVCMWTLQKGARKPRTKASRSRRKNGVKESTNSALQLQWKLHHSSKPNDVAGISAISNIAQSTMQVESKPDESAPTPPCAAIAVVDASPMITLYHVV
jgi:hypothetical protein